MIRHVAIGLFSALGLIAQEPTTQPSTTSQAKAATEAIESWLAAPQKDLKQANQVVALIMKEGKPGFEQLSALAKASAGKPEKERTDADKRRINFLNDLILRCGLSFIAREVNTNMVFAGQYDGLRTLQPQIGETLLGLVINTPKSFDARQRPSLIPVLRDIYPEAPSEEAVSKLKEIAKDEDFEPMELRRPLVFALAQWGDRSMLEARIKSIEKRLAEGDESEKAVAQKELADDYYQMRDYTKSADLHRQFLRNAEKLKQQLAPVDYYNAACNLSLSGDIDGCLAEIEACLKLQNSDPAIQASRGRVDRSLFENDPDLRAARSNKKFMELVNAGFKNGGAEEAKK